MKKRFIKITFTEKPVIVIDKKTGNIEIELSKKCDWDMTTSDEIRSY